jgi:hypothetical protein
VKFAVHRLYNAGSTEGFVMTQENLGFRMEIKCAGVRVQLGDSVVFITRDEACAVASMLQDAARDG